MRELIPQINEPLVTPEDILIGDEFIAEAKRILKAKSSIENKGIRTDEDEFRIGYPDYPSFLLIPSPEALIESRRQYHDSRDGGKGKPPEINEPMFLGERLAASLDTDDKSGIKMTAVIMGHEGRGVWYNDIYTFNPEEHTLAVMKYKAHEPFSERRDSETR